MRNKIKRSAFIVLAISSVISLPPSFAADTQPKFDCTLTDKKADDGTPGDAKTSFAPTTPVIYLLCSSDEVKKGQSIKAAWIAIDTNNAAPANYKIAEKGMDVDKSLAEGETWDTDLSLTKPNNGWPVGSYKVELYVDGVVSDTFNFTVK